MGGNVRVGLEDSLYLGKGELAKSNAEQVAKIRRILEELSLEIATPGRGARSASASRAATTSGSEHPGVLADDSGVERATSPEWGGSLSGVAGGWQGRGIGGRPASM